jgi:hypothetical protein
VQAASRVDSLNRSGALSNPAFLKQLVEFGFQYARLNLSSAEGAIPSEVFLDTLWKAAPSDTEPLRGVGTGLGEFFANLSGLEEAKRRLEFGQTLLQTVKSLQNDADSPLYVHSQESEFVNQLLGLGGAYAALNPQFPTEGDDPGSFLETLSQSGDTQKAILELVEFVQHSEEVGEETDLIAYQRRLLTVLRRIPQVRDRLQDARIVQEFVDAGLLYRRLRFTSTETNHEVVGGVFSDIFHPSVQKDLHAIATAIEQKLTANKNAVSYNPGTLIASNETIVARNPVQELITGLEGNVIKLNYEQFLSMGIVGAAPASRAFTDSQNVKKSLPVRNIKRFIELVELEEKSDLKYGKSNPHAMVSRLRRIFYNTYAWNSLIIANTDRYGDIYQREGAPYGISNETGERFTPEIFAAQEVHLGDDKFTYIDMGHVFTALDAINNPNPVPVNGALYGLEYFVPYKVDSNIDNATWVGDIGGVIAEWARKAFTRTLPSDGAIATLSLEEAQALLNDDAEPQDLLGDIDGLVIGSFYSSRIAPGIGISDILRNYYLESTDLIDGLPQNFLINGLPQNYRDTRFSTFAYAVGLGSLSNGRFTGGEHFYNYQKSWFSGKARFDGEEDWINYYATQVANSAAQILAGDALSALKSGGVMGTGTVTNLPQLAKTASLQIEPAKVLLRTFLKTLKIHIQK